MQTSKRARKKRTARNLYLYNGKELDTEFGLNWYHYGARMYDPAIARFTGVDPISDKFANLSTYNYASNSPIANVDLHGLQAVPAMLLWNYIQTTDTYKTVTAPQYNYAAAQQQYNSENSHVAGLGNVDGNFGNANTTQALGHFVENGAVIMDIAAGQQSSLAKNRQFSFTSPKIGSSKLLNETGSITNLRANGAVDFDDFNSGQGFSGVYDEGTDAFVLYPSGNPADIINYADGSQVPSNLRVGQFGGHAAVDSKLTQAVGSPTGKRAGFSVVYGNGTLDVRFNSGMVNSPNFGQRTAPQNFQNKILDALNAEFGTRFNIQ